MIIKITGNGLKLNPHSLGKLDMYFQKIKRLLPRLKEDLLLVSLFIKQHDVKYHLKRKHRHIGKDYSRTKTNLAHYDGWLRLILPKKALYVHFKGASLEEGIHTGIKHLIKETKKYKELHFKSNSQYPDHKTLRKRASYG